MYAVEYRRFYLRDLQSVVVWPTRLWLLRLAIPAVLLVGLAALLWRWLSFTSGAIFGGVPLAWFLLELALGPTATSSIRIAGGSVELPLVMRTRRARKVLAKIDAALRAARAEMEQPVSPAVASDGAETSDRTRSESAASTSVAAAAETNAF